MNRYTLLLIALLCFNNVKSQPVKHVIIVSIDGFRPDFYKDPSYGAVNLQQMAKNGVQANGVNSIFPTLTFPNHTAIITGVTSAKHGIYFNAPFEAGESSDAWYWYFKDIKSPTLWEAARKSGMKTVSVNWPVSAGAPIDYNIPIIKMKGQTELKVMGDYATPAGLLDDVQRNATGTLDTINFNTEANFLVMDENVARISAYLFRKYKPALTTLRLSCVDHFEHIEGREGDLVNRAVAGADRAVRTMIEAVERAGLKDSTAIIVCGDHGFVNIESALSPNIWLSKAGLLDSTKNGTWKAKFNATGGSAFLMIKDPNDVETVKKAQALLSNLPADKQKLFRVIDRKTLDKMGITKDIPLALAATPGVRFSGAVKGKETGPGKGGTHGYFPDFKEIQTGFIGYGAGFGKGVTIPVMSITDIAPNVAHLLGLKFDTADGQVIQALFK